MSRQTELKVIEALIADHTQKQVERATFVILAAGLGLHTATFDEWRAALHLAAKAVPA